MKVREIMTTDVATATPETTLEDIATMMRDEDTGAIPVLEDDELVGIITDRDIVVRCIAEGKDPVETTVEDVLTEGIETIEPESDIEEAREIMSRRQIRRLPVVEEGELVGMLSIGDIAVKSDSDVGDTLEDVSEGVKTSSANAKSTSRSDNKRETGDKGEVQPIESGRKANARAGREGGAHAQSGRANGGNRGNAGRNQKQAGGNNRKQIQSAGKGNRNQEQTGSNRKNVAGKRVEAKAGTRRRAS